MMDTQDTVHRPDRTEDDREGYQENIVRIRRGEQELILLGTAHVSRQSARDVRDIVEAEEPDTIAVELCAGRLESMKRQQAWQSTDIYQVIREKKAGLLLANLILGTYQRRIAQQFGIEPGAEMRAGVELAEETGRTLLLADRNIQVTLARIWRRMGLTGRVRLLFVLILSIFSDEEIGEEELEELRKGDALGAALNELGRGFPELKTVLIDERDAYMAEKLRRAGGQKVLAILGAGHLPGVERELAIPHDLSRLDSVPPSRKHLRYAGWAVPLVILLLIGFTLSRDLPAGISQMSAWILWNGSFSALGALLARGHPLTILSAFLVAPISSLNPLLAAGWFAGLVEAYIRKPRVGDFESLSLDLRTIGGLWKNKVTRILLVVVLANLGSTIGTLIGGAEVVRLFLRTLWGG